MKSYIFRTLVIVLILLGLNYVSVRAAEQYRQFPLAGLMVTLSLERHAETVDKVDWPAEPVELTSQSVTVRGKTIHELLLAANIYPDVEAFTLVYALNPELRDLRKLSVAELRIPKLVLGAKLDALFAQGFQVWLTIEKDKKQQFDASVQELLQVGETASKSGPSRFESPVQREEFLAALKNSSEILEGIAEQVRERYGRTIPKAVLIELGSQTNLLIGILKANADNKTKFDTRQVDTFKEIESDLKRKARIFKETAAAGDPPEGFPTVEVSVKTLQEGHLVPNLRIYFVPKFGRDPEEQFGMLTTDKANAPAKRKIDAAEYCFWGARDPTKTPVTNEVCQPLYLNYYIELTVIK